MPRLIFLTCAAMFIFGGIFAYLAWWNDAPESAEQRQYRLFEAVMVEAKAGSAAAQIDLGEMFEQGLGTEPDMAQAAKWYKAAAERNDPKAYFMLGRLYEDGKGVRADYRHAASLYAKAGLAGNADAQFALGQMHFRGRGVIHDYGAAIRLLSCAANRGHPAAQFLLGGMYREGWGVPRDFIESYKWYTLAMPHAAETMAYNPRYDPMVARTGLSKLMGRHQIEQAEAQAAKFLVLR